MARLLSAYTMEEKVSHSPSNHQPSTSSGMEGWMGGLRPFPPPAQKLLTATTPTPNGAFMGSVLFSSWAGSHSVEFRRAMAISRPENRASQHRVNAALLVFDCCWLFDVEIAHPSWTYITLGGHIAFAGCSSSVSSSKFLLSHRRRQNSVVVWTRMSLIGWSPGGGLGGAAL